MDHVFGVTPNYEDLAWEGLHFTPEQFEQVTHIDKAAWLAELGLHAELFQRLAYHLPPELLAVKDNIEARLT